MSRHRKRCLAKGCNKKPAAVKIRIGDETKHIWLCTYHQSSMAYFAKRHRLRPPTWEQQS